MKLALLITLLGGAALFAGCATNEGYDYEANAEQWHKKVEAGRQGQ